MSTKASEVKAATRAASNGSDQGAAGASGTENSSNTIDEQPKVENSGDSAENSSAATQSSDKASNDTVAIQTVAMHREEPSFPGGPVMADVHLDEVNNFIAGGWRVKK